MGEVFDFRSVEEKMMVFGKQVFVMFGGGRDVGSCSAALCDISSSLASSCLNFEVAGFYLHQ